MQKTVITKRGVAEVLATNTTGVKFANKSLNRRFEKNKKIVERQQMLQDNERKRLLKKAVLEKAQEMTDEKMMADLSVETDQDLISAYISLGMTVSDMIEGKVDTTRALRIQQEAEKIVAERLERKLLAQKATVSSNPTL